LDAATFLGGLGVGIVSAYIARWTKTPVAIIAYAGAVTMMPGLSIYRALGGLFQMARLHAAGRQMIAQTFGNALHACLVVGALALGLVIAMRLMEFVAGDRDSP
jgi:uncharacterized membrane protein YjjB (DUF3815 family)